MRRQVRPGCHYSVPMPKPFSSPSPADRRPAPGRAGRPAGRSPERSATGRLFFALQPPQALAQALADEQRALRGKWKATPPGDMHLTLAFLPSVPLARVPELAALGERVAASLPALSLRLRGTGYFPNEGSPRVWFVKAESEGEGVETLAAALRSGVAELGLSADDKPFKAHLTLARKKGPAPRVPPRVLDLDWPARALLLVQSRLHKSGPEYLVLHRFPLQSSPPPPQSPSTPPQTPPDKESP